MRIGVRITEDSLYGVAVIEREICGSVIERVVPGNGISMAFEHMIVSLLNGSHKGKQPLSIAFDVSRLLVPSELERVVALRIAPRPPIDAAHKYTGETAARHCDKVEHVTGGFTKEGDEIAALDLQQVCSIAFKEFPGRRYVVTGVGSSVNPMHEVDASRVLFKEAKPASVNHSHSFHNSSFAVRERTAIINSALLSAGERIVTSLAKVVTKYAPLARLHVMTNDGGAVPLSTLAVKPVHSMLSTGAAELVGAAVLAGVDDGWIVIERDDGAVLGEMTGGAPAVTSRSRLGSAELIATRTVQVMPNREGFIGEWMGAPTVVRIGTRGGGVATDSGGITTEVDLAALGAACAPVVEWLERDVKIRTEIEKDQVLAASEAKVRVRLVSNGVPPSLVRIMEARVIGTSYENSNTVAVRVRGVGGMLPSEMLAKGTV